MSYNSDSTPEITLETLYNEFKDFRTEFRSSTEQVILRMESILINRPSTKKAISKKNATVKKNEKNEKKEAPVTIHANTMYWWASMYATGNPDIKEFYTDEDVDNAIKSINNILEKPEGHDKEKAIGLAIWRNFPKSKKTGVLKTGFENWKKEHNKKNSKNNTVDPGTDGDVSN